jgi:hypothetical protein
MGFFINPLKFSGLISSGTPEICSQNPKKLEQKGGCECEPDSCE